jgi:hypothetical protein
MTNRDSCIAAVKCYKYFFSLLNLCSTIGQGSVNLVAPPKAQNCDPNLHHLIQIYNSMDVEKRAKILSFAIGTAQKDTENEEDEAPGKKLTNVWAGLLKLFTNRK